MLRNSRTFEFLTPYLLPVTLNKDSTITFKLLVLSVDSNNLLSIAYFLFTDAMQLCNLA